MIYIGPYTLHLYEKTASPGFRLLIKSSPRNTPHEPPEDDHKLLGGVNGLGTVIIILHYVVIPIIRILLSIFYM